MAELDAFPKIDAHVHLNADRNHLLNLARRYNFSLLTINTEVPEFPPVREQRIYAHKHQRQWDQYHIHFAATFSTKDIDSPAWTEKAIRQIETALTEGACGVKFWKNIGMDLQRGDGSFIMIDAPELHPLFDFLEEHEITLLGHQGEPRNCWLPLDQMTVQGDRDYFSRNPQYHMYRHPEYPGYWEHIASRDQVLARHPGLRFVGLHLASLEWDLHELAQRLDRYPNLAVDLAERMPHLYHHASRNREEVITFFKAYQDRIIYGTDLIDDPALDEKTVASNLEKRWKTQWRFLATGKHFYSNQINNSVQGLGLPPNILKKIYYSNAVNWYNL